MSAGSTVVPKCYRHGTSGYWGYRAGIAAAEQGLERRVPLADPKLRDAAWDAGYDHGYDDVLAGKAMHRTPTTAQLRRHEALTGLRQVGA